VIAAWAVQQTRLNHNKERFPELFKPPVLERIESLFEALDVRAVVSVATMDAATFRPGNFDGTDDVPRMARTDNVWSQCAVFTIGALIRYMFGVRQNIGTVDIYFDPKSLSRRQLTGNPSTQDQGVRSQVTHAVRIGNCATELLTSLEAKPCGHPVPCTT
jgi:hypothetical protein